MRRYLLVSSLCFALALSIGPAWAEDTVAGPIEAIDNNSLQITVDGQRAQITAHTTILTPSGQPLTVKELVVGAEVVMSTVEGSDGTEAASIQAAVLR